MLADEALRPPESRSTAGDTVGDSGGGMSGDSNTAHSGPEPKQLEPSRPQAAAGVDQWS